MEANVSYRSSECRECDYTDKCLREAGDIERCQKSKKRHLAFITNDPRYLRAVQEPWKYKYIYSYNYNYKKKKKEPNDTKFK